MKLANYAETFKANLRQMISDVQVLGGTPVSAPSPRTHTR